MVTDTLKSKVLGLIKQSATDLGVNLRVTARIKDYSALKVNIQSCSIDLKQNMLDTIKDKLLNGRLLGTDREYLQIVLSNLEQETDEPQSLPCSEYKLDKLFSGQALELMEKLFASIRCDYYCNSDSARDYFDVAYYYELTIGKNKSGFKVV